MPGCAYPRFPGILLRGFPWLLSLRLLVMPGSPRKPILFIAFADIWFNACCIASHAALCYTHILIILNYKHLHHSNMDISQVPNSTKKSKLINHDQFWVWHIGTLVRYSKSNDALELSTHAAGNATCSKTNSMSYFLELSPHNAKCYNN